MEHEKAGKARRTDTDMITRIFRTPELNELKIELHSRQARNGRWRVWPVATDGRILPYTGRATRRWFDSLNTGLHTVRDRAFTAAGAEQIVGEYQPGDYVVFGRARGEHTIGLVQWCNLRTVKVRALQSRGRKGGRGVWRVSPALLRKATPAEIARVVVPVRVRGAA